MVQNFHKNSFSGGKSGKNGIPVIKITFSLKLSTGIEVLKLSTGTKFCKKTLELQVSMSKHQNH